YGLHEVSYEGGFHFQQNAGYDALNGYQAMGSRGYSSGTPNVGMYASLDPQTEPLAIAALDQFYAAGGTLPIVFESTGNINSWAVAAPDYFNWNTPKQQAAASGEQALQAPTFGLTPGQWATFPLNVWIQPGQSLRSVWLVPAGSYTLTINFGTNDAAPPGETEPVEVLVDGQLIATQVVPAQSGGT